MCSVATATTISCSLGLQYMAILSLLFVDVYFAVAIGTTISSSQGRQYGAMFSLSFLDVYAYHYVCSSHFLKPVQVL
jgi:hypothetical protein